MLPTLYKKNKNGSFQMWSVSVDGDTITVTQGQYQGKLQTYTTICKGKNIGKSNETTPEQQALLEAKAKHTKQQDKGYQTEMIDTPSVLLPMKVKVFQDNIKNVKFPCYCSPKLDGVNGLFVIPELGSKDLKLYSRGGKEYPMLEHLKEPMLKYMESIQVTVVNVELYATR